MHCDEYHNIRDAYFTKFQEIQPHFTALPNAEKCIHILGENSSMITTVLISQWTKLKLLQQPFNDFLVSCLWEKKYVLMYLFTYGFIDVFLSCSSITQSLFILCLCTVMVNALN